MGSQGTTASRLKTTILIDGIAPRAKPDQHVAWAQMPQTTNLKKTIDARWPQIETFIETRAANAKNRRITSKIEAVLSR